MKTIWKFMLATTTEQVVPMPKGAKPLCVGVQETGPMLWAEVDTEAPFVDRLIEIIGTGRPMYDTDREYVGTVHADPFVWHVYDHGDPA